MKQYKFKSTYKNITAELCFRGLEWSDNKNITSNITDFKVSVYTNGNIEEKRWETTFVNKIGPIHPWENICLCTLSKDYLIIGIENIVHFIHPKTGVFLCSFILGNTPIVQLNLHEQQNALYILLQYQGFVADFNRNKSNLYKIVFNTNTFTLLWSANLGINNELVKEFSVTNLHINVKTTGATELKVDTVTGNTLI